MQEKNKFSLVLFIALSCIFATFLDLSFGGPFIHNCWLEELAWCMAGQVGPFHH